MIRIIHSCSEPFELCHLNKKQNPLYFENGVQLPPVCNRKIKNCHDVDD